MTRSQIIKSRWNIAITPESNAQSNATYIIY